MLDELNEIISKLDAKKEYNTIVELLDDNIMAQNKNDYRIYVVKAVALCNIQEFDKAKILIQQAINLLNSDITDRPEKHLLLKTCEEWVQKFNIEEFKHKYNIAYDFLITNEYGNSYREFKSCFELEIQQLETIPLHYGLIKYTIDSLAQSNLQAEILEIIMKLLSLILKLYSHIEYKPESAVHYTNVSVAQLILLFDDGVNKDKQSGKLQFGFAPLMNDPEEGEVLLHFIENSLINKIFYSKK